MATTVKPATAKVTVSVALNLGGVDRGTSHTFTINSVTEQVNRIVNVPTTEVTLVAIGTAVAAGQHIESTTRLILIVNKDDTNHVGLVFTDDTGTEFCLKLDAGQFLIYNGDNDGGVVDTMIAAGSALTVTSSVMVGDLVTISAIADTAAVDLELYVLGD